MMRHTYLLAILVLLLVSACQSLKPNARVFNHVPSDAPAPYKQGWKDGCQSGLSAGGNDMYRTAYHYVLNQSERTNPAYMQGWQDAEPYCRHYAMSTLWEGNQLGKSATSQASEHKGIIGLLSSWGPGLTHQASVSDPWDHFFGVDKENASSSFF